MQDIGASTQMQQSVFGERSWVEFHAAIKELQKNVTSASGFTLTRPKDFNLAISYLRDCLQQVPTIIRPGQNEFIRQILRSIEALEQSPIRFYPNELLRLHLVKAEVLIECNEPAHALATLSHVAERPYLIEDVRHMLNVLRLQQVALIMLGRKDEAAAAAWRGIFLCGHVSPILAAVAFRVFADALHLSPARRMSSKVLPRLLASFARIRTELRREAGSRITRHLRRLIRYGVDRAGGVTAALIAVAPRHLSGLPEAIGDSHAGEPTVLVTRAMGGIGDIVMMMPGLRALARQTRQRVHFATRKSFFPLFAENTDVLLHDIDGPPLDLQRFRAWYNLSLCPAAHYESRHRPNVEKGRVELFAGGMGISEQEIDAVGLQPHIRFSEVSKHAASAFFAEHGLDGHQPVIAVHAFSRETYRDYPRMDALIKNLASKYKVIVFHHVAFPLPSHPNIVAAFAQPMGDAFATFARCTLAVCADSSFFHVAAALDMPTVALFGPTDGSIRSKHHRKAHIVSLRCTFKCMPCWRNEDTPCQLTRTMQSACMMAIDENDVVALVDRVLAENASTVRTDDQCSTGHGAAVSTAPS